ncbi:MAG: signal peptidase [Solirubrobacterales bacterium]|nr:signal peptidase [Solirubrobacterales bacterium]
MRAARARHLAACLWVGALWAVTGLVLCLLLAAAAPRLIGDASYVVRSGSMTPVIETGDVLVTQPIDPLDARVGQIVTFKDPSGSGRLLSHRARAVHRVGDRVRFVTQGDANSGQEHWNVPVDGRIGRVLYRIPKLGFALVWTQGPVGRIGLIAAPALLLAIWALVWIWNPRREGRPDARTS